ncbi:FAD-binding protein, partial [Candidatus Woesebacteria bacterium]|nr:FAD-binding protein [Candidatus Woesebacteria bacterium]
RLAPYTTVKIGGPAEVFCQVDTTKDLADLTIYAKQHALDITILGWGANTLIADRGIRGLVVKNTANAVAVLPSVPEGALSSRVVPRWDDTARQQHLPQKHVTHGEHVAVRVDAGTPLSYLINTLLQQNIVGLEWFARIPATLGGAIYNNIHGAHTFISDYIHSVEVVGEDGRIHTLPANKLAFAYDYSRFHHTNEVILSAILLLYKGNGTKALKQSIDWAKAKKHHPQNSLGCIFQNLSAQDQARLALPTPSVSYVIDQVLDLKGFTIGGARVSEKHAAFIENTANATADEYLAVIKHLQAVAREQSGVQLQPEIFFKGFTTDELAGVIHTDTYNTL